MHHIAYTIFCFHKVLLDNFKMSAPIQALGCILYLLCFKQHPFEEGAKLQIVNGKYSIPQNDMKYTVYHDLIRTYCQPIHASIHLFHPSLQTCVIY